MQILFFPQTSALDGETDLKSRVIPSACMGIDLELLHKIKARNPYFFQCAEGLIITFYQ